MDEVHNRPGRPLKQSATARKHLGDRHRMHLLEQVNRSMKLIHYSNNRPFLELIEIADPERPPISSVPEYLFSRQLRRLPD